MHRIVSIITDVCHRFDESHFLYGFNYCTTVLHYEKQLQDLLFCVNLRTCGTVFKINFT